MTQQTQNHQLADLFHAACHSGNMDAPRLLNLGYLLMQTETVPGAVVEMGCNKGATAAFLLSLTAKPMFLFDSFQGLPPRSDQDGENPGFVEGAMKCSRWQCVETFSSFPPERFPKIIEGWFEDTAAQLPDQVAFCHCDFDFHNGTKRVLEIVYPLLSTGAIFVVDDYSWPGLPGVKIAVDKFLHGKPEILVHPMTLGYRAHQGWFVKL